MTEYGHIAMRGRGIFIDQWGEGPYVLTAAGRRYVFEDSARFGPVLLGKDGHPIGGFIPEDSPFWLVWQRWKDEGRQTRSGKVIGRGDLKFEAEYCKPGRKPKNKVTGVRAAK